MLVEVTPRMNPVRGGRIGLAAAVLSLFLFLGSFLQGVDDYLGALFFQLGYAETGPCREVLLIRKDEETAAFLERDANRQDYAAMIRFLGRSHEVAYPGVRLQRLKLADFRVGWFPDGGGSQVDLSFPTGGGPAVVSTGGFWTFADQIFRLPDFLGVPESLVQAVQGRISPASATERLTAPHWGGLVESLGHLEFGLEFRFFPKAGTVCQVVSTLGIQLPEGFTVPPAAVIGLDIIMQGRKPGEGDAFLREAIAAASAPIILAAQTHRETARLSRAHRVRISASAPVEVSWSKVVEQTLGPDPTFLIGPTRVASVDATTGRAGTLSSVRLFQHLPLERRIMPSFALLAAVTALDRGDARSVGYVAAMERELERVRGLLEAGRYPGGLTIADLVIPTDREGNLTISFFGSTQTDRRGLTLLQSVPLKDCLDAEELRREAVRRPGKAADLDPAIVHARVLTPDGHPGDRICLLGTFEATDFDSYETPLSYPTPFALLEHPQAGIEVQANAILTILRRRFLNPPRIWETVLLVLLLSPVLGKLFAWSGVRGGGLFLAAVLGLTLSGGLAARRLGHLLLLSPLLISPPLTYAGCTIAWYLNQKRQAQATRAMFQRFVSPGVVQRMLDRPDAVKPGGDKAELTVFFSDLAGFSTFSEVLTPEQLVQLLNEYLGRMTQILFQHGGTLDKFIGDAVMAFWNYPCPQEDHALRACLCALDMQETIRSLRDDWKKRGFPVIHARAGLNTAQVVVGFMGDEKTQLNFTCMGDGVNLASRLEGANKEFETSLMISHSTWLQVNGKLATRFLDYLAVKGKNEPVRVYELVARKGSEPHGWHELVTRYEHGIAFYRQREWTHAIAQFEEILALWPDDGPCRTYLARCRHFQASPPPPDWDGSYHLTHK